MAACCETRYHAHRFRVDRITTLAVLDERSRDVPGRSLAGLFRRYAAVPP